MSKDEAAAAAAEQAPAKYEKRKGLGVRDARYAAMIEAMDTSIGRVLKSLDDANVADDTLVVFTSDNGAYKDVADNRPLRLGKGYLYEGGIRVPMIVHGKSHGCTTLKSHT